MTISRANEKSWFTGDRVTATQLGTLDANLPKAVDAKTTGATGLNLASRAIGRTLPYSWINADGNWTWETVGGYAWNLATSVSGECIAQMPLRLPQGVTATHFYIGIEPNADAAKPASLPSYRIWQYSVADGSETAVSDVVTDPSASDAEYSQYHTIPAGVGDGTTPLATPIIIDNTAFAYYVQLTSGSGAGSEAGTRIVNAVAAYTTTRLDEDIAR